LPKAHKAALPSVRRILPVAIRSGYRTLRRSWRKLIWPHNPGAGV